MTLKRSDEALLVARAALSGDREAFSRLVEAYQSPVRRLLFHLTGGAEELSKDLAQETFLKAWLGIASFRAAAGFSTWLYRIACNTFHDHLRSAKHSAGRVSEMGGGLAAEPCTGETKMDLLRALGVLSPAEREAVLLRYMEDQPVARIAAIMRIPSGTVKSHLSRGRGKLAVYLKQDERWTKSK